jgi:hypothetical protein
VTKAHFSGENKYFDTHPRSISAIPFTKNQRIRQQPTGTEAVEVWEASVLVLSTLSFLVGAALAQRFKIMVLIPAVATVLMLAVGIGFTNAYTSWSIVVTAATAATSMQIGYLIGMSIHGFLAAASSRSAPSTSARHSAR